MLYDPKKWAMPEVPVRESKLVEALKAARAMIEHRWCPKGGTDDEGGVCAVVALSDAIGSLNPCYEQARGLLRAAIPIPPILSIPEWNDTPGRTQQDVLQAFDRAIALARAND